MLCVMLLALIIYYMIFRMSKKMMNYEFQENLYKDFFIASHSIVVRGINKEISVEAANQAVRKVFEKWYSKKVVLSVHTQRITGNVSKLYNKIRRVKQKIDKIKLSNHYNQYREILTIGKWFHLRYERVDAEDYYTNLLHDLTDEFTSLKQSACHSNKGIAFVTFKDKDKVGESIEEIESWKLKFRDHPDLELANIEDWDVDQAPHPSDIIWKNLNKNYDIFFLFKLLLAILPVAFSVLAVGAAVYFDEFSIVD